MEVRIKIKINVLCCENVKIYFLRSEEWGVDLKRIAIRDKEKNTIMVYLNFNFVLYLYKLKMRHHYQKMFRDRSDLHQSTYQHHLVKESLQKKNYHNHRTLSSLKKCLKLCTIYFEKCFLVFISSLSSRHQLPPLTSTLFQILCGYLFSRLH